MKILIVGIGLNHHIGSFFDRALTQLEIPHRMVDEWNYFGGLSWSPVEKIWRRFFSRPLHYHKFNDDLGKITAEYLPDVILVTQGLYINPRTIKKIKNSQKTLFINYATDDPFNTQISTSDLVDSIPLYDLYACTKRRIMEDIEINGCDQVTFIPFGYDPSVHYPQSLTGELEINRFSSDITFIGGADQDRIPIMQALIQDQNINLHLYGIYWDRVKELRKNYHGFAYGEIFRKAYSGTKIGLCLVRRANRDGHAMRTFEIPACGTFMLAERTEEHQEFFCENQEAVFFSDVGELLDKFHYYKKHDTERRKIAEAGKQKILRGKFTYLDRIVDLLKAIDYPWVSKHDNSM